MTPSGQLLLAGRGYVYPVSEFHPDPDHHFGARAVDPIDCPLEPPMPARKVAGRLIVMVLLIGEDRLDYSDRIRVGFGQRDALLFEVPKHDPLDRTCGCMDGPWSKERGHNPQTCPAQCAKMITPATWPVSSGQFGCEKRAMMPLVGKEIVELGHERGAVPCRNGALPPVDADSAMLSGMVNLDDAVAQRFPWIQSRAQSPGQELPPV